MSPAPESARPPASPRGPLGRRALVSAALLGAISLVATLFVALYGDDVFAPESASTDAFSRSALGHRALVEVLEATGITVTIRRASAQGVPQPGALLVMAEPRVADDALAHDRAEKLLLSTLEAGAGALLVLPKWEGERDPRRPAWVSRGARLRDPLDARAALTLLPLLEALPESAIQRPGPLPADAWTSPWPQLRPDLPTPQLLARDLPELEPVISCPEGVLLARHPGGAWVLSDPDLLNNAGLGRGDNASIVHRLVRDEAAVGRVIVDEVIHGFERPLTLWAELATFPLSLLSLHLLGLLLIGVWAGVARFGEPLPLPPRIAPGKETLIRQSAELLTLGSPGRDSARRYLSLSLRLAARAAGLPAELPPADRRRRLTELSRLRGLPDDPHTLAEAVASLPATGAHALRVRAAARRIHRWRAAIDRT